MRKIATMLLAALFLCAFVCVHADGETGAAERPKILFVGDSRTVFLMRHCKKPYLDAAICEGTKGYSWFKGTAWTALLHELKADPRRAVFLWMGVNDCVDAANEGHENHVDLYAADYNYLVEKYPDTRFFVGTAGPVFGPVYEKAADGGAVEEFNEYLKENCEAEIVDVFSFIRDNGFGSYDGIHYDKEVCVAVYDFILSSITASLSGEA